MSRERGEGSARSEARATRILEDFVARARPAVPDRTADLEMAAVEICQRFESCGIDTLVLKGPALAHLLYKPTERRTYLDVDLLVAPGDLDQAREVLVGLGYRDTSDAIAIDDIAGVVHDEMWVGPGPAGGVELVVELHRRFAGAQASPQVTWDALAGRSSSVEVRGTRLPVLRPEGQAMHVAMHAAQHGPRYAKGLDELTLGLERWPLDIWRKAAQLAAEIGATESFAAGLRLVPEGTELAQILGLPPTDSLDWEIRRRLPRGSFHLQALGDARGMRARAQVLRRALLPSREWIKWQFPWARARRGRLLVAYGVHLVRAPLWAVRAWRFRRQAGRAR